MYDQKFSDQVNKITFSFIWDNKTAKIKKTTLIGEKENGGLNVIDVSLINKALKFLWVKHFSLNENSAWTVIANEATSLLRGFNFLVTCNCNNKDINLTGLPTLYQKTLEHWFEFKNARDGVKPCAMKTVIWNNRNIKVDNKTIFFRTWFEKGVST